MLFLKAIQNLPEKIAVTANLSVDYKAPTRADQVRFFVQSIRIFRFMSVTLIATFFLVF